MKFLERQLEDPVRLARNTRWFYYILAAVAMSEIMLSLTGMYRAHPPHFKFEWFPAWGSVYGLVSCVTIIVVSKFLGKVWLMRSEDYYDT